MSKVSAGQREGRGQQGLGGKNTSAYMLQTA